MNIDRPHRPVSNASSPIPSDRLYLDHAATSFPKPEAVLEAMTDYATRLGASPGRGAYAESREAGERLESVRRRILRLLGAPGGPEQVVFTLNASDALNLAIRGIAIRAKQVDRRPPHLVTTWMDHNSVLRPFNEFVSRGLATQTRVRADCDTGCVDPEAIRAALREETRLVAIAHGSNVTGTIQPIAEIGAICRAAGVPLLVDAAQTLGHHPLDVDAMGIDLLAFPGHKGLLGPLGTGGLWIRPGLEDRLATVREGGTGSVSEHDVQPEFLPDRFEPGSHNTIGLLGLGAGLDWILERGVESLHAHETRLVDRVLRGLEDRTDDLPGFRLLGPGLGDGPRAAVFSFRVEDHEPDQLATRLEAEHGLLVRAGLHCAPLAHRTMGSAEVGGTVRASFGPFNEEGDADRLVEALAALCRERARHPLAGAR